MITLNWFDILLVIIILSSLITGLRAGLARVVVGLVAALVGLLMGFWCYRIVGAKIMPYVNSTATADILGFLAIFAAILILGSIVSSLLSRLFNWMGLSWFNHFLGGVAGFLRGALVVAALADVMVAFSPSPTPAFLERSRVLPYASEISLWLVSLAPRDLRDACVEQMQNLRQLWAAPRDRHSNEV